MFLQCGGYRASSLRAEYWQADASNKAGLIVDHKADPCLVQAFRVIQ